MSQGTRAVHEPPPDAHVALLVAAGVSQETALAMERWKAVEVLDLLRVPAVPANMIVLGGGQDGDDRHLDGGLLGLALA